MQVLALANQKGGCGKTTTAIHLAGALAVAGRKVCVVDMDPQAHATLGLGCAPEVDGEPTLVDVLRGESSATAALRRVPLPRGASGSYHLLPSSLELAEIEEAASTSLAPERALSAALPALAGRLDYVLLDCPPRADGVLAANAVRASDAVVLVVETGAFALQGALRARSLFEELACGAEHQPTMRVLATMFDRRTRFARDVLIAMQARFGAALFDTAVRVSVRLREAAAHGLPVQVLDARSRAAADFAALAREISIQHPGWAEPVVPLPSPSASRHTSSHHASSHHASSHHASSHNTSFQPAEEP